MSPVRRSPVTRVTVAAVLACCLGLSGCSGSSDSQPTPTAAPSEATESGTPLEDVDTSALVVPRAPFCDRVDPVAVARALGEEAADVSAYRSGQRVRISEKVSDVVHEFGCRWSAADGRAEAWVFAPPVTRKRAAALARNAQGSPGCAEVAQAPGFGRPSATCATAQRGSRSIRFQGLFGDAWLSCSLTLAAEPPSQVAERASRWCAAVAMGATTGG